MDRERLEQLNAQASEHYLGGEYAEALSLWRQVLEHDPDHEQAQEGVRLAESMAPAASEPTPEVEPVAEPPLELLDEDLLEDGLGVLDELPDRPTAPPTVVPDPDRQAGGIDLGDGDDVASLPVGSAEAEEAAAGELSRRLEDLLNEAETALAEGRREDARSTIGRIFILDEDNARARELESRLEPAAEPEAASGAEIESWLTEGVQWLEQDRVEEARGRFLQVLEMAPEHLEALAYLQKADALLAAPDEVAAAVEGAADEDALSQIHTNLPEDPDTEAVPLVSGDEASEPADEIPAPPPAAKAPRARAPKRRSRGGRGKWIVAAVAAVVVLAAVWYVPRMLLDRPPDFEPLITTPQLPASAGVDTAPAELNDPVPANADRGELIERALARAEQAMTAADYSAAVIAYNDVLSVDPDHEAAGRGLRRAGDLYRQQREADEQLRKARIAFEDGDYAAALRIFYRLPEDDAPETIARYRLNGWFNMGVVALKAGDPEKAASHLAEAAEIDAGDRETEQLLRLAQAYSRRGKDRTYYRAVDGLGFRGLDD